MDCTLPIVLLAVIFLLKILVNRRFSLPDFISAIIELPVELIVLIFTLSVSYEIIFSSRFFSQLIKSNLPEKNILIIESMQSSLLTQIFTYLGFIILVFAVWRVAEWMNDKGKVLGPILISLINYTISVYCLFNLVQGVNLK